MNNQQIKNKILADITAAKEKGYTIVSGHWGNAEMKCACPLGCVNLAVGNQPQHQELGGVLQALGVDLDWITDFIDGYDGNGSASGSKLPEIWNMGEEIRKEVKSIHIDDYVNAMDNGGKS